MKAIKFTVISMGLLLIGGMALLMALAFEKAGEKREVSGASECKMASLRIPKDASFMVLGVEDGAVSVQLRFEDGSKEVWLVDTCEGKVVRRLRIKSE